MCPSLGDRMPEAQTKQCPLRPSPTILNNLEVAFVKFKIQIFIQYLGKSGSKLFEPGHPPPPFNVQKKVKLGENKTTCPN